MSRIADLGPKLANLPKLLDDYERAFEGIEGRLTMIGKTVDAAQKEQGTWPIYYETRRVELKTLVKYMDAQVQKVRGEKSRYMIENMQRSVGERMIGTYVDADADYMRMYELHLEVEELYEKFAAACEAFQKRGFALRDITASRIAQIQDQLL